jgi:hypothetical protein
MTITFQNDNDAIVFALEIIITFARNNQHIILAQSIWWISSIIRLQPELIRHLNHLRASSEFRSKSSIQQTSLADSKGLASNNDFSNQHIHPDRVEGVQASYDDYLDSEVESVNTTESEIHNEATGNCKTFFEQSKQERKAIGCFTKQANRVEKLKANKEADKKKKLKIFSTQTEGIDGNELRRRKAAGECQRCAWPRDRKGSHKNLDCFRWKRLENGTAPFPKKKVYDKEEDLGPYL